VSRVVRLGDAVFSLMAELVRKRTGIVIQESHCARLENRLAADARAAGSFYELYVQFREDSPDSPGFGRLLDAAVNGETYFFRDAAGLRAFAEEIVPERRLASEADGVIEVWSAGCATGEEAYTLAMVLAEKGQSPSQGVLVKGTDASPAFVRKARLARSGPHSLRETSVERRDRFFRLQGDGSIEVKDEIRSCVTFEGRTFSQEKADGAPYDVIVCRNVLIYLDREARDETIRLFASRLKPGGYLLLGPSDVLAASLTPLTMVRLSHDVAYRK
jgi:chemotaxis protein methyltransferase CheR